MKKIYALFVATVIGAGLSGQCVINSLAFGPPGNTNYSIIPDTIVNLPLAYVNTAYVADLQFHIKPDTTVTSPVPGTYNITQIHIDSVIGLPANFAYLPNPASGTFLTTTAAPPGTGYGCVGVSGMATAGQENGGPSSNGIYPIIVYYTATVDFFSVPTPIASTQDGYKLHILPASGFNNYELSVFSVTFGMPNPADSKTDFRFNALNNGTMQFTLYDALGSMVKQESVVAIKGINQFALETSSLAAGVYMCTFNMGNEVVTRRITVSH